MLIHAGAGGVGMAAIQLAQHLGAEVFATASPAKWEVLREAGLAEDHIASSRDLELQGQVPRRPPAAREWTSSSTPSPASSSTPPWRCLPRGGRFLEMGKTDIRDPEQVAAAHPGVAYRAFDLVEAGPRAHRGDARRGRSPSSSRAPCATRRSRSLGHAPGAREAFRHLQRGHATSARSCSPSPGPIDPERTVLITGATGGLGALIARHLVEHHGARHLLLVSRSGPEAEGRRSWRRSSRSWAPRSRSPPATSPTARPLEELLASVPAEHPLGAVVHCAGALADATSRRSTPSSSSASSPPRQTAPGTCTS